MNRSSNENIDRLRIIIKKYSEILRDLIVRFEKVDQKADLQGYCNYTFLLRFYYNSNATMLLLPKLKNDDYYKIPIGIITRTCMSDVLTFYYFYYLKKNKNQNEFDEILKTYLAGSLHYFKTHIENDKKNNKISIEEYNDLVTEFKSHYSDYYEHGSNELIQKQNIKPIAIKEALKTSNEFDWVTQVYDNYDYLSKYEHFSALTFDIQELHKSMPEHEITGLIICYGYVYEFINSIITIYNLDNQYKNKLQSISKILTT